MINASELFDDITVMKPARILEEIEGFVRRYCVLPEEAYLPFATWVVATYLSHAFECFPYIAVTSPLKRCGKSRVLDLAELLCYMPLKCAVVTAPVLFRMLGDRPTVLLDEAETLSGSKSSETQQSIIAVLNVGFKKDGAVPRCEGQDHKVVFHPAYSPKAIAAIGGLPETIMDRSIPIRMQRKRKDQKIDRFLAAIARPEAEPIASAIRSFAEDSIEEVRTAYLYAAQSKSLDALSLSDRDIDIWLALIAVCAVASPDRVPELRRCAEKLSASKQSVDEDDVLKLRLLADLRECWPDQLQFWESSAIVNRLLLLEESPWDEAETRLTAQRMAKLLREFGVRPAKVRDKVSGRAGARGYHRDALESVWERYL